MRLKAEKGGEAAVKLEKEERKRLEEDKDEDGEISATSTPVKAGKEAALGLDLSPTRCKGEGARMSPVPEEEDSGFASFLTHSLAPDTSPTLEQALLLPLLDEPFEAKSICFVVDIDLRVIGLLNPRGRDDFKSRN